MKIILSRKGFDSSAGGVASPILPGGEMISLPIPETGDPPAATYRDASGTRRPRPDVAPRPVRFLLLLLVRDAEKRLRRLRPECDAPRRVRPPPTLD